MPTTLVTGATGFLGSHVARALAARGDDVRVTVRATSNLDALAGLEVQTAVADLADRRAVRRGRQGGGGGFPRARPPQPPGPGPAPLPGHPPDDPGGGGGGPPAGGRGGR